MKVLGFIIVRIGIALFTIFCISVIVFLAMRMLPGGFETIILGPIQTEEAKAMITERFGLDRSLPEQFLSWIFAVVRGDFGMSMITQTSVADELLRRAPATIQLALMSVGLALIIGIPLGILSGLGNSSDRVKKGGRLVGALGASTPDFVLGTMLVYVFSVWSLGLKVGGYVPLSEDVVGNLQAMTLPTITLSVFGVALILRTARDSVLGVMTNGYITTAVARGDTPHSIVVHHVIRNATPPVLTVTAMYLSTLIGGAVIVELLFSIPGIGLYTWNALFNRDYVVTQTAVLLFSTVFVTVNMLVDIAYAILDPRISASRS